jgi:hypothetical protein
MTLLISMIAVALNIDMLKNSSGISNIIFAYIVGASLALFAVYKTDKLALELNLSLFFGLAASLVADSFLDYSLLPVISATFRLDFSKNSDFCLTECYFFELVAFWVVASGVSFVTIAIRSGTLNALLALWQDNSHYLM